mgnify:CR=1 FL=1
MGITLDRGRYYFVLNVPNHLYGKVLGRNGKPVRQIRSALRTTDLSVAKRKAFELEELKRAEWQLLAVGEHTQAHEKYLAAKRIAENHGFDYRSSEDLLQRSFEANLPRMMAAAGIGGNAQPKEVVDALLGGVEIVLPNLRTVLGEYIELTKTRHLRKSDKQRTFGACHVSAP